MASTGTATQIRRELTRVADFYEAARKKRPTHEVREKKDPNAPIRVPGSRQRNDAARDLAEGRVNIRSGPHKNKGQQGQGQKGKGKPQRHPKHKRDLRPHMASRVATRFLLQGDTNE